MDGEARGGPTVNQQARKPTPLPTPTRSTHRAPFNGSVRVSRTLSLWRWQAFFTSLVFCTTVCGLAALPEPEAAEEPRCCRSGPATMRPPRLGMASNRTPAYDSGPASPVGGGWPDVCVVGVLCV